MLECLRRNFAANLLYKYLSDEDGMFAPMAAICFLTIIIVCGAAVDTVNYHKHTQQSQSITDSVALAAAVYVKNNGSSPDQTENGFLHGKAYNIDDLGVASDSFFQKNFSGTVTVNYDDVGRKAHVTLDGKLPTFFMSVIGYKNVRVKVASQVNYYEKETYPTSVFLVMDNSGSMAWDDKKLQGSTRPSGAQSRISGLKTAVSDFNTDLHSKISEGLGNESSVSNQSYLRMAMIPYANGIIQSDKAPPSWKTLPVNKIQGMQAGGGTDSRDALDEAEKWMAKEDNIHRAASKNDDPKKYVIFMSDGANNADYVCDWEKKKGTSYWRKKNGNSYSYMSSWYKPGKGWQEGRRTNCRYVNNSNIDSLETCDALKADDVEIYTIGYALEPGQYYAGSYGSYATISTYAANEAYDFLRACASTEEHFIKAEDASKLKDVFEHIGRQIIKDVIRISG